MPIRHNDLSTVTIDMMRADDAFLEAIGKAGVAAAKTGHSPECPVITGNLIRSHGYLIDSENRDVIIGVTADYGGDVHNGTKRRKAKPWLKGNIEAARTNIINSGISAWARELE